MNLVFACVQSHDALISKIAARHHREEPERMVGKPESYTLPAVGGCNKGFLTGSKGSCSLAGANGGCTFRRGRLPAEGTHGRSRKAKSSQNEADGARLGG